MPTDDATDRLRRLAEAATPGPYRACLHVREPDTACKCGYPGDVSSEATDEVVAFLGHCGCPHLDGCGRDMVRPIVDDDRRYATGRFIAACDPQTILQLLDSAARPADGPADSPRVAAALCRFEADEYTRSPNVAATISVMEYEDLRTIAAAYASRPAPSPVTPVVPSDDDEPATREWWNTLGKLRKGHLVLLQYDDCRVSIDNGHDDVIVFQKPTRGDVRRLAAALGIPLSPAGPAA